MNILISACLLGINCRYDGTGVFIEKMNELKEKYHLIPICPEIYGGLQTPREPAEIREGKVVTKSGTDVIKPNYTVKFTLPKMKQFPKLLKSGREYEG